MRVTMVFFSSEDLAPPPYQTVSSCLSWDRMESVMMGAAGGQDTDPQVEHPVPVRIAQT